MQMTLELDLTGVAYLVAGALVLFTGAGIALYERFRHPSRTFLLFTTLAGTAMLFYGWGDLAPDAETAHLLYRLSLALDALMVTALYGLATALAGVRRPRVVAGLWAGAILLGLASASMGGLPRGIRMLQEEGLSGERAWLGLLYALFITGAVVAALVEMLFAARRATTRAERRRALTVLLGFGLGALGLFDFIGLPEIGGIESISPFAVTAAILVLGYAATRQRVFAPDAGFTTERVLAVMADAVLVCDARGRVRTANRSAHRLLGMNRSELRGLRLSDILDTDGEPFPGGRIRDRQMLLRSRSEGEVEVRVSAEPLVEREEVVGSVVVMRDVRERVRTERALRASEARYQSLFWHNPGLAYEFDTEGRLLNVNAATERLMGGTSAELAGSTFADLVVPEDLEETGRIFARVLEGEPQEYEIRIRTLHGAVRDIRGISVPILTEGRVTGVFGVALDRTEERRMREQLEVQRRQFADLFEGSPEGIVILEGDDRVVRVNREFTRMFGYEPDEVIGHQLAEFIVPEGGVEESRSLTAAAREGGVIRTEAVRRRKDGSNVNVSVLARSIDLPGQPTRVYGIYRDIGDRIEAERQLRLREEELRHALKLEAVGKLAGGVAHDFNNLVTVITGHARLLLEGLTDGSPLRTDLEEIERAGTRAADLTQQLLAFSRRQLLRPESLDVSRVIRNLERMLKRLIGEHIELETRFGGPAYTQADRSQLEQVIVNLAVNARDAMPEGGRLTIKTGLVEIDDQGGRAHDWGINPGAYVRIDVRDTGIGMDAGTLAMAFDPFFTTKELGKGTGLGLATVFGIVKQSGGHVTAASTPGQGARFSVYLPAVPAPGAEEPDEPAPEDGERAAPSTILLVEDEAALRNLVERVLRRQGHHVILAADGADGLERAETFEGPIDLIVTDLVMPRMGGREMARRILDCRPGIGVLFMSGYDEEILAGEETPGPGSFLAKPFTPAQLVAAVDAALIQRVAGS